MQQLLCSSGYNSKNSMILLQKAIADAEKIVELLSPHTSKIYIAGSCRRQKPEVDDIDIVCLPKRKLIRDVFGEFYESADRTKTFIQTVDSLGTIIKGSAIDGRSMRIRLHSSIPLDLSMPNDFDFYRVLALRTGSPDYAREILAKGWRRRGWCGTEDGLRKEKDCVQRANKTWKCVNSNPELPPVWQSEEEFFEWLKVRWVLPKDRNV